MDFIFSMVDHCCCCLHCCSTYSSASVQGIYMCFFSFIFSMGRAIIPDRYTKHSLIIYKSCYHIAPRRFIYSLDICYSMYRRTRRRTGSVNRKLVKNSTSHYPKEVLETGCALLHDVYIKNLKYLYRLI